MEASDTREIVVKKEPSEAMNEGEDNPNTNQTSPTASNPRASSTTGPLRYVSRRGRPPGGGYSMKSHAHYVSFTSAPLTTTADLGRQSSIGSSSSLSAHDLLKTGAAGSAELDIRRFGFQGFDSDKNSFRCDGCDVVFSSRDTYAMHMLLRAKNESCVALPTSAISSNPENPTPREKFERELRQQAMITALRNQAAAMSKAAAAMIPKSAAHLDALSSLNRSPPSSKDNIVLTAASSTDNTFNFNSLFSLDAYGFYVDPRQYRRFLEEYGLRAPASTGSLAAMMEHLSCSACGELFSNKDALAMHMMFHTRDEEIETKPSMSWADINMRPNASRNQTSTSSSTSSSSVSQSESRSTAKHETSGSKQRETNKSEDRELTAERVAELKRMAIESSLRSPSKKTSSLRPSPRSKSASQDMAVTSSAHSRPMSADDVMRFSKSALKTKTEGSPFLNCPSYNTEDHLETRFYKKRHFSTLDDETIFEVRQVPMEASMSKKMRHENNLYDLFCRSNKQLTPEVVQDSERESKVCDNHVSSASGPQDSDDTSEENSLADQEANSCKDVAKQGAEYSKTRDIPYLEAIMSQEAVLVPIDTTDIEKDSKIYEEDRVRPKDTRTVQGSALDFSTGNGGHKENFGRSSWYVPQDGDRCFTLDNQQHGEELELSPSHETADRNGNRRNVYYQYQGTGANSIGRAESRGGHSGTDGSSPALRQTGSVGSHHDTDRPSRHSTSEAVSRVGEARYCPHCEILFLDVTLFHLHMGLHNVNNPWQCNTCGLVCSGRLEFNTHVLHY